MYSCLSRSRCSEQIVHLAFTLPSRLRLVRVLPALTVHNRSPNAVQRPLSVHSPCALRSLTGCSECANRSLIIRSPFMCGKQNVSVIVIYLEKITHSNKTNFLIMCCYCCSTENVFYVSQSHIKLLIWNKVRLQYQKLILKYLTLN